MPQSTTAVRAMMMNRGAATHCADARLDWFAERRSRRLVRLAFARLHNTGDAVDAVLAPTTARRARLGVDRPRQRRRCNVAITACTALILSRQSLRCLQSNRATTATRRRWCGDSSIVVAALFSAPVHTRPLANDQSSDKTHEHYLELVARRAGTTCLPHALPILMEEFLWIQIQGDV